MRGRGDLRQRPRDGDDRREPLRQAREASRAVSEASAEVRQRLLFAETLPEKNKEARKHQETVSGSEGLSFSRGTRGGNNVIRILIVG